MTWKKSGSTANITHYQNVGQETWCEVLTLSEKWRDGILISSVPRYEFLVFDGRNQIGQFPYEPAAVGPERLPTQTVARLVNKWLARNS